MAKCVKVPLKNRRICIGDFRYNIELNNRDLQEPKLGGVDFGEIFTPVEVVPSYIETKSGETIFDDSNQERSVTHRFYIRFLSGITAETWIRYKDVLYDVLTVENLEEKDEYLILRCSKRGPDTVATNFA